ncbi:MAG: DoxX family protein [Muribaculaceae bacterium]|nr:DoxX family protein [Muribaculaceae bacterium]
MAKINWPQRILLRTTGFSYTNMARLFMRLFVGVMFMQFGIRHWVNYDSIADHFPTVLGLEPSLCLQLMIVNEIVCSTLIIVGLLTRLATVPPIVSMIAAEYYILHDMIPADVSMYGLDSTDPGYLPIMFIGIYCFLWLAGPGKISLDYMLSLKVLAIRDAREEDELEDV